MFPLSAAVYVFYTQLQNSIIAQHSNAKTFFYHIAIKAWKLINILIAIAKQTDVNQSKDVPILYAKISP